MMKIRAHHLICMTLFEGHGYDEKFTERMSSVIGSLSEGEKFILVSDSCDDICSACPNNSGGSCVLGDDDVRSKDEVVIKACNLETDSLYDTKIIRNRLSESFDKTDFDNCCKTCRWYKESYCRYNKFSSKIR